MPFFIDFACFLEFAFDRGLGPATVQKRGSSAGAAKVDGFGTWLEDELVEMRSFTWCRCFVFFSFMAGWKKKTSKLNIFFQSFLQCLKGFFGVFKGFFGFLGFCLSFLGVFKGFLWFSLGFLKVLCGRPRSLHGAIHPTE